MSADRTVVGALRRRVAAGPDAPFVRCGGDWITLGRLDERSDRVATGLADLGVQAGERVAVLLPNREEIIDLFFATTKLGAVLVPLNAFLKGEFLRYQLADCDASVLVTDGPGLESAGLLLGLTGIKRLILLDGVTGDGSVEEAAWADIAAGSDRTVPAAEPAVTDLVALIYTSGTTGLPKGCMLSHGYYVAGPQTLLECGWVEPGDRIFTTWPLFHSSGQVVALMTALVADGSVVFEPQFSATTFLARAVEEQATVLAGVGFMGLALLAQPASAADRGHGIKRSFWIPMAPAAQIAFEERFGIPVLAEAFGQTECFPISMAPASGERARHTLGPPTSNYEIALLGDDDTEVPPGVAGEICIRPRTPGVMYSGYWNKPDETVAAWRNLWHHTGDMARRDEAGRLVFVDRKKDALRRRGENVSSLELEAAILAHPGVAAVAVCAVASPVGEDDIKACIVPAAGADLDPAGLFDYFKAHLPYFAVPRYVQLRDALPTNALGRVMKHVLRSEGAPEGTWDLESLGLTVAREERRGAS
ncbi:MAG TPA: AMP-binding protein [Acidimicrobiia bacterium]|nr:AMP-binding protein [Acidimicrobiia bacterium]